MEGTLYYATTDNPRDVKKLDRTVRLGDLKEELERLNREAGTGGKSKSCAGVFKHLVIILECFLRW